MKKAELSIDNLEKVSGGVRHPAPPLYRMCETVKLKDGRYAWVNNNGLFEGEDGKVYGNNLVRIFATEEAMNNEISREKEIYDLQLKNHRKACEYYGNLNKMMLPIINSLPIFNSKKD